MDIYKIVKGNSFYLFIKLQKAYISKNKQMLEDIDVAAISNLEVHLTDAFGDCVAKMPFVQSGTHNSEVETSEGYMALPFVANTMETISVALNTAFSESWSEMASLIYLSAS